MNDNNNRFEVIIVGGSYAGLSAGMALGRALRKVLIIDSGKPANRTTPHAHNFITHDGVPPSEIAAKAKAQVLNYDTVQFITDTAMTGKKIATGYSIQTNSGRSFEAQHIIFATGVKDILPATEGFEACWGKSVIHCPYCHGYEVKGKRTGILVNDESAKDFHQLISQWTDQITLFTNGEAQFNTTTFRADIIQTEISHLEHQAGYLSRIVLADGTAQELDALYFRPPFEQHCSIPKQLGCDFTESGHLQVDEFQRTNMEGIYAAGDCTTLFRSLAIATAQGNVAGAMLNHELITAST